jgi:hypothetical protein
MCDFAPTSLEYLGHIIYIKGVAMDPNKVSVTLGTRTLRTSKGCGINRVLSKTHQRLLKICQATDGARKNRSL